MPNPGMRLWNLAAALDAPSAGEEDFANHEEVRTEAGKHTLRLGSPTKPPAVCLERHLQQPNLDPDRLTPVLTNSIHNDLIHSI